MTESNIDLDLLVREHEMLKRIHQQLFDNMQLLIDNDRHQLETEHTVIQNQALIIQNQDIIVRNQSSIINNQKRIVQNQSTLQLVLQVNTEILHRLRVHDGIDENMNDTTQHVESMRSNIHPNSLDDFIQGGNMH